MIRETELNLFVPSPELLVQLASAENPLGLTAGPPRLKLLRETFFDTPGEVLRARGMTCKLRLEEGKDPLMVVTVGEGPDSEGITSRIRLTASAVGAGVFETLRGDSEPAEQIRKFVDPRQLRPRIALEIRRLSRLHRTTLLRRPIFFLHFDRIAVRTGAASTEFHELRVRRRRAGGPEINELARRLRDKYHLFPDGLSTLQRAYQILAMERKSADTDLSPYALTLALALFRDGEVGLTRKGDTLSIPTFRGSGEDAARALLADLTDQEDLQIFRLGTTEVREGRPTLEVWTSADPDLHDRSLQGVDRLEWVPWHDLLESMGSARFLDRNLLSALLLLTRRHLMGDLTWVPPHPGPGLEDPPAPAVLDGAPYPEIEAVNGLNPLLRQVEDGSQPLLDRLGAASRLSTGLAQLFLEKVAALKGRILSEDRPDEGLPPVRLLDLISVRTRGIGDRLYRCFLRELLPAMEQRGVKLRAWSELSGPDRRRVLEEFKARWIPKMHVAHEWGPSLVPEMPPAGCAVGLGARPRDGAPSRFFHHVLTEGVPAVVPVPGSPAFLPLEEIIKGQILSENPELEGAETHLFRFTTGEVTVRMPRQSLEVSDGRAPGSPDPDETKTARHEWDMGPSPKPGALGWSPPSDPTQPGYDEISESIVTRVMVQRSMPESFQAQLIRALERQVSRRKPLIGWSDLFVVEGPLDLAGLEDLPQVKDE